MEDKEEFKRNAARLAKLRESSGETSIFSRMQPFYRPELHELHQRRIDVLHQFDIKDERGKVIKQVLRWCQGKVIEVYEDKPKPTVKVEWDPMPDVEGCNKTEETDQVLLPTYWKKDTPGAWRMDVDIDLADSDSITGAAEDNDSSEIEEWSDTTDYGTDSSDNSGSDSD